MTRGRWQSDAERCGMERECAQSRMVEIVACLHRDRVTLASMNESASRIGNAQSESESRREGCRSRMTRVELRPPGAACEHV